MTLRAVARNFIPNLNEDAYTILDMSCNQVRQISETQLRQMLQQRLFVENIELKANQLICNDGSINELPGSYSENVYSILRHAYDHNPTSGRFLFSNENGSMIWFDYERAYAVASEGRVYNAKATNAGVEPVMGNGLGSFIRMNRGGVL